jgi:glycosyltransferase involved in cell wall biosynthesis
LRVLLLNQYYAPDEAATAQLLSDLGAGLAEAGHEVIAVCGNRGYFDPDRRYPAHEFIDGVEVRRVRTIGMGARGRLRRLFDYLSFYVGATVAVLWAPRSDVIVALSSPPLLVALGALVAKLRKGRLVYWLMDLYPDIAVALDVLPPEGALTRLLDRFSCSLIRGASSVVVLGEDMKTLLCEKVDRDYEVIENWTDGSEIQPLPVEKHAWRKDETDRKPLLLYSGNMGLAHEFKTFLDAMEALPAVDRPRLAFVGGGARREKVQQELIRREIREVTFRPWTRREDLGLGLTWGDAHLITLDPAVLGMLVPSKVYGVLAAGRPTLYIGPLRGTVYDRLREDGAGDCFEVGDSEGVAGWLRRFTHGQLPLTEMGRGARQTFERNHDRSIGVARFLEVIRNLKR